MRCRDVKYYLTEYLEGKLIDEMRKEISLHLNNCNSCRKRSVELKAALKSSGTLKTKLHQVGDLWESISEQGENDSDFNLPAILFSPLRRKEDPRYKLKFRRRVLRSRWIAIGAPLAAILLAVIISALYFYKSSAAFWQVEALKGYPTVKEEKIEESGALPLGEWLKTDSHSKARLRVGISGVVDVDPGSELQLSDTKDNDYRLYLRQGKIYTTTWAPESRFSVLTPSASVIVQGSTYSLEVDKSGSLFLYVTSGNAEVKSGDNEEIVPVGVVCEAMPGEGLGTPYYMDASTEFKAALSRFDLGSGSPDDLDIILKNSRSQDALSLWYLLKDAKNGNKELIYNKLAELVPPPAGVNYEGIKNRSDKMLYEWWEELGYGKKSLWEKRADY